MISAVFIAIGYVSLVGTLGLAGVACCLVHAFIMVAACHRLGGQA